MPTVTGGRIRVTLSDGTVRAYDLDQRQVLAALAGLRAERLPDRPTRVWKPDRERDTEAWRMRRMGYGYGSIAAFFGVSVTSAKSMVTRVESGRYGPPENVL